MVSFIRESSESRRALTGRRQRRTGQAKGGVSRGRRRRAHERGRDEAYDHALPRERKHGGRRVKSLEMAVDCFLVRALDATDRSSRRMEARRLSEAAPDQHHAAMSASTTPGRPTHLPAEDAPPPQTPIIDFAALEGQKENILPIATGRSAHKLFNHFTSKPKQLELEARAETDRFERELLDVQARSATDDLLNDDLDSPDILDVYVRSVELTP